MKDEIIQAMKNALSGFIEDLIQSENGPSEDDIQYIKAESERLRQMQIQMQAA